MQWSGCDDSHQSGTPLENGQTAELASRSLISFKKTSRILQQSALGIDSRIELRLRKLSEVPERFIFSSAQLSIRCSIFLATHLLFFLQRRTRLSAMPVSS